VKSLPLLRKALLGFSAAVQLTTLLATTAHAADLNNGEWFGDHVPQNGQLAIKGNVWTSQHIYYVGDELSIQLDFPRGYDLIAAGTIEAHIVVFARAGAVYDIPIPSTWGAAPRKLWRIPDINIDELPEGQYQIALILTKPGGKAKQLQDWYGGIRALLDSEAIYIAATPVDTDENVDGEHDDDRDHDGITGEEADEVDDDSPR
jgi:hypothetical protein